MVANNTPARVLIPGAGWANPLQHPMRLEDAAYTQVWADDTQLTLGTDYTLSGLDDDDGFEVTINTPSAWNPTTWVVVYDPLIEQKAPLSVGGVFDAATEDAVDELARRMMAQEDKIDRALIMPNTTPVGQAPHQIPEPQDGYSWGWDGETLVNIDVPEQAEFDDLSGDVSDNEERIEVVEARSTVNQANFGALEATINSFLDGDPPFIYITEGPITPQIHGADPNGATGNACSVATNAAITAAAALGRHVLIPNGDYRWEGVIVPKSGVVVECAEGANIFPDVVTSGIGALIAHDYADVLNDFRWSGGNFLKDAGNTWGGNIIAVHGDRVVFEDMYANGWAGDGNGRYFIGGGTFQKTVADGVINAGTDVFLSASSVFSGQHTNARIVIDGAGVAAAPLAARIVRVLSPQTVQISIAATTTVAGASTTYTHFGEGVELRRLSGVCATEPVASDMHGRGGFRPTRGIVHNYGHDITCGDDCFQAVPDRANLEEHIRKVIYRDCHGNSMGAKMCVVATQDEARLGDIDYVEFDGVHGSAVSFGCSVQNDGVTDSEGHNPRIKKVVFNNINCDLSASNDDIAGRGVTVAQTVGKTGEIGSVVVRGGSFTNHFDYGLFASGVIESMSVTDVDFGASRSDLLGNVKFNGDLGKLTFRDNRVWSQGGIQSVVSIGVGSGSVANIDLATNDIFDVADGQVGILLANTDYGTIGTNRYSLAAGATTGEALRIGQNASHLSVGFQNAQGFDPDNIVVISGAASNIFRFDEGRGWTFDTDGSFRPHTDGEQNIGRAGARPDGIFAQTLGPDGHAIDQANIQNLVVNTGFKHRFSLVEALPPAAESKGIEFYIENEIGGGDTALSNGALWKRRSDGATVVGTDIISGEAIVSNHLEVDYINGEVLQIDSATGVTAAAPVRTNNSVTYDRTKSAVTTSQTINCLPTGAFTNGGDVLLQHAYDGQSTEVGRNARPLITGHDSAVLAGKIASFERGPRILFEGSPTDINTLCDWGDIDEIIDYAEQIANALDGETSGWQYYKWLDDAGLIPVARRIIATNAAIGGQLLEDLGTDEQEENRQRSVMMSKLAANKFNMEYALERLFVRHGGANRQDSMAVYQQKLVDQETLWKNAATTHGGQTDFAAFYAFTSQCDFFGHPTTIQDSEVPLAQLQIAFDEPKWVCTGPDYVGPSAENQADNVHKSALGMALLGAYRGVYDRDLRTGQGKRFPLYMLRAEVEGVAVRCRFVNPLGQSSPLAIDTSWVTDPANPAPSTHTAKSDIPYGIMFRQTGGSAITIDAGTIAVEDHDLLTFDLTAAPDGTDPLIGIADYWDDGNGGNRWGPRCCIRNTSMDVVDIGGTDYTLHDYAAVTRVPLTIIS